MSLQRSQSFLCWRSTVHVERRRTSRDWNNFAGLMTLRQHAAESPGSASARGAPIAAAPLVFFGQLGPGRLPACQGSKRYNSRVVTLGLDFQATECALIVTAVPGQGSIVLQFGLCPTGTYGDIRSYYGPTVRWSKGGSVSSLSHRSDDKPARAVRAPAFRTRC
jgi:hypothetical protein